MIPKMQVGFGESFLGLNSGFCMAKSTVPGLFQINFADFAFFAAILPNPFAVI